MADSNLEKIKGTGANGKKRRLALLLSVLLIFTVFVSCSEVAEVIPEYEANLSKDNTDLAGQTIVMGVVNDYFFENDSTLSYINNTELGDLAIQRISDVEKTYNCKLETKYVAVGAATLFDYAVAGTFVFDFLSDESYDIVKFITSGVYVDLTGLDNIDVFNTTKWGNRYMTMSTMYNGAIYGVLPAQHPMRLSNSTENIIAVNEDYVTMIAANDPRDYFENGEWNWAAFEDCLETFAHKSVTTNEFIYSFSGLLGRFSRELGTSNGSPLFTYNGDGTYTFGYFSQNAIDAYNKAYEWFFGALSDNILEEVGNDPILTNFTEGHAVMSLIDAYMVLSKSNSIAYQMENFGLVPVPYGPGASGPEGYSASYRAADFTLVIPVTAKDPETSALIIDAIYEPFPGYETREQIIDYLERNYFKDVRDARFFIEMTDDGHAYYHDHHRFSGMFDQFRNTGITKGIEANRDKYINAMMQYDVPMYSTLVQYEEYFHE